MINRTDHLLKAEEADLTSFFEALREKLENSRSGQINENEEAKKRLEESR